MNKQQFFALYNEIEQTCQGSQEQAARLAELIRRNIFVRISSYVWQGARYLSGDLHPGCNNGLNVYRSLWLLEIYAEVGNAYQIAWHKGRGGYHHCVKVYGPEYFQPLPDKVLESEAGHEC
jgi:hypothetical protein